ncbi:MAG: GNAT family N-acetyltransferase [Hyphomonas sp.]|uniref:GNAT family N-acetyltransferase n=1 Tax=Hyphomonas sp. TaxID=87 RepID=UPI001DF9F81A|nr:GNAT family N-acetyltransferase [Hyphomonas sp.]MBA4226897.1 GNAT family N-acetyltransferase [Hyphomonas sp.]
MTGPLRLRRDLSRPLPSPDWPGGISLAPFTDGIAPALHALMAEGYGPGEGDVSGFEDWWPALRRDSEFDPQLVFTARAGDGSIAGVCQCWTSAFVKDLVVAPTHRRRGIGAALMLTAFAAFQARGARHVDLKVMPGNARAIALYQRLGMTEARDAQ